MLGLKKKKKKKKRLNRLVPSDQLAVKGESIGPSFLSFLKFYNYELQQVPAATGKLYFEAQISPFLPDDLRPDFADQTIEMTGS